MYIYMHIYMNIYIYIIYGVYVHTYLFIGIRMYSLNSYINTYKISIKCIKSGVHKSNL